MVIKFIYIKKILLIVHVKNLKIFDKFNLCVPFKSMSTQFRQLNKMKKKITYLEWVLKLLKFVSQNDNYRSDQLSHNQL